MNLKHTSASLGSDAAKIPASKTAFRSPLLHDVAWFQIKTKGHNITSLYFFEIGAMRKVFSIKSLIQLTALLAWSCFYLFFFFYCNVQTSCLTSLIINLPCTTDPVYYSLAAIFETENSLRTRLGISYVTCYWVAKPSRNLGFISWFFYLFYHSPAKWCLCA